MPAIVAEGLEREFSGGIRAVDGVDLEVAEGEIYGFLGPNGAGKTTTVRMLTTLLALAANTRVVAALGGRALRQTARRPQLAAPLIVFPSLLLAIQTGGAGSAVELSGFPEVNGFLDFMLAGAMMQACMLAGNTGAIAFALDMEMGFTDPSLPLRSRATRSCSAG